MGYSVKIQVRCPLACSYCYESSIRKTWRDWPYDLDRLLEAIRRNVKPGGCITLHGGEPLLQPIADMERLLLECAKRNIRVSMQTSSIGLTRRHIEMFRDYGVTLGISVDGHLPQMNLYRANGDTKFAEHLTKKVLENIERLIEAGNPLGIITVLHRQNAPGGDPTMLKEWLRWLYDRKIIAVRLNPMNPSPETADLALTDEELGDLFVALADYSFRFPKHNWRPFRDIPRALLQHKPEVQEQMRKTGEGITCIFEPCDVYHTVADITLSGDGAVRNCLQTANTEGIPWLQTREIMHLRQSILLQTPFDAGGCVNPPEPCRAGENGVCVYWKICHGLCPDGSVGGDWRNRNIHCLGYGRLFAYYERILRDRGERELYIDRPLKEDIDRYNYPGLSRSGRPLCGDPNFTDHQDHYDEAGGRNFTDHQDHRDEAAGGRNFTDHQDHYDESLGPNFTDHLDSEAWRRL
jgi:uncharacterized protein